MVMAYLWLLFLSCWITCAIAIRSNFLFQQLDKGFNDGMEDQPFDALMSELNKQHEKKLTMSDELDNKLSNDDKGDKTNTEAFEECIKRIKAVKKLDEGDINRCAGKKEIKVDNSSKAKRGAANPYFKWPKVNGELQIPYTIEGGFTAQEKATIEEAVATVNGHLTECNPNVWRKRTNERDYVAFVTGSGCSSHIGKKWYRQTIELHSYCLWDTGITIHEMLHAMNIIHEQSRKNRDDYVTINYANVISGYESSFSTDYVNEDVCIEYDYESIMHYGQYDLAADPNIPTIYTKDASKQNVIGQRSYLSMKDITKLHRMYGCTPTPNPCPKTTIQPPTTITTLAPILTLQPNSRPSNLIFVRDFETTDSRFFSSNGFQVKSLIESSDEGMQKRDPEDCKDKVVFCKDYKDFCYISYMETNCKETCSKCDSTAAITTTLAPFVPISALHLDKDSGDIESALFTKQVIISTIGCSCPLSPSNPSYYSTCQYQSYCQKVWIRRSSIHTQSDTTVKLTFSQHSDESKVFTSKDMPKNEWVELKLDIYALCDEVKFSFDFMKDQNDENVDVGEFSLDYKSCSASNDETQNDDDTRRFK